ncbi:MAG TPA: hypothetical protein ENJ00_00365 [Phycisphaerales bacterium]|nr:hypothetical protein [Phycisphaerales bacterium]
MPTTPETDPPNAPAHGSANTPAPGSDSTPKVRPWNKRGFSLKAGIAAIIFPGLGHITLGLPRRGRLITLGVLGLFMLGLLIGGLDAVDSRNDRWWFAGQALVGPIALGTDFIHQTLHRHDLDNPNRPPTIGAGLGRINEVAMLAGALAGLMNLIAIVDAMFPPIRRRSEGARL